MASLDDIRHDIWDALQTGLTALRIAPEHPTEQLAAFPAMVVYVAGGTWEQDTSEGKKVLARVVVEIHVSRPAKGLHRAIDELQPYLESVANLLFKARRDNTFAERFTFGTIDFEILASNWAGVDTTMARFTINDVKVRNLIA